MLGTRHYLDLFSLSVTVLYALLAPLWAPQLRFVAR